MLQILRSVVLHLDRSVVDVRMHFDLGVGGPGGHWPSLATVFLLEAVSSLSRRRWISWIGGQFDALLHLRRRLPGASVRL